MSPRYWLTLLLGLVPLAPAAAQAPAVADQPDLDPDPAVDLTDSENAPAGDDAAVALLQEGLGATVIGEVDAS